MLAPEMIRGVLERVRGIHIGIDLGQRQDPSTIAVVEVGERATTRTYRQRGQIWNVPESTYKVQEMTRLDLGTSYVQVSAHIVNIVGALWQWEYELRRTGAITPYEPALSVDIWADATGVGRPVMDLLSEGLQASPRTDRATLHPVVFTHGDRFDRNAGKDGVTDVLGKAYLVSRLQVLFQELRIKLPPNHEDAQIMAKELKDYEICVDEKANDTYGAFTVGSHDDYVTALGLACIEEPGYYSVEEGPKLW
jgi:hypothetical protein